MEFKSLEEINEYFLANTKSDLFKNITNVVPGEGDPNADVMFIGEAPGAVEDKMGRPFVGPAGKFLDVLLESIGLDRSSVFITNTVKCRPPENRDPSDEEKQIFAPWLKAQIDYINPKVFVPLGRHALGAFLPNMSISKVHGKIFTRAKDGRAVFAMYHPAVALYNGSFRDVLLSDMQNLKQFLEKESVENSEPVQIKMF
jgi:uracil-DNA glycosylase